MTELRTCKGSARFGIEPHEAPLEHFPKQSSQKDGYGRLCTVHWRQYTAGLARDAKARQVAEASPTEEAPAPTADPKQKRKRASDPAANGDEQEAVI